MWLLLIHPHQNQVLDPESLVIYGTNVTEDGTITPDKSVILEEGKDYTLEVTTDNETGQQKLSLKWPILKHLIIWNIVV